EERGLRRIAVLYDGHLNLLLRCHRRLEEGVGNERDDLDVTRWAQDGELERVWADLGIEPVDGEVGAGCEDAVDPQHETTVVLWSAAGDAGDIRGIAGASRVP